MPDLFASAKRSLRRAQHHIMDLAVRLNALNPDKAHSYVIEHNTERTHETHKLRFHPSLRDEFPSVIFDAISNMRACLDQTTHAISNANGLPEEEFAYFPICKDVQFIENRINGLKYLPSEIRALFRSFNPYKGGNEPLWALNELSNIKKHAALVPINMWGAQLDFPGSDDRGPFLLGNLPFDAEKNEIVIAEFAGGARPKANGEITFAIVLNHPSEIINGQHPIFLLQQIHAEVARVLAETEAECRRIRFIS